MRTTARGLAATATTLVVSGALCLATGLAGGSAAADPGPTDPGTPSQAQVDAAQARADAKADDVASLRRSLVAANARLDAASTKAEIATEKYDAARWHLQQAQSQLTAARSQAATAQQAVADHRADVAALVNQSFRGSTQLDQLTVIATAKGPANVLTNLGLIHAATSSMDATFDRYQASLSQARVAKAKAASAEKAAAALARASKSTRAAAASAQAVAERDSAALAGQRDRLVHQLAEARHISVALATKRQEGLEHAAQVKAQQQAAAEAAAQEAAQEEAQQQAAQEAAEQQAAQQAQQQASATPSASASPSTEPTDDPSDDPTGTTPTTDPTPTPAPAGAAAQAIAYAKAQLGKPYKWAATGPSSFDCSGLTMRAWEAAGVSLPHYSAGQYAATTHITRSQLQPGDLIFWGSSPGSIHHVAMYLGDGMMIHAPRTGQDVMIASIDYWIAPNYFSRP